MSKKRPDLRERMVYKDVPGFRIALLGQDEVAWARRGSLF
jgi:hypothetical protein